MPEICLSGSEGGAKHALSLPLFSTLGTLKIKEFALQLKGREAGGRLAPIVAQNRVIRVRN
jgi:hypothetical protein